MRAAVRNLGRPGLCSAARGARLYAEEFNVALRQFRGNLPQAFVHALLLECAVRQDLQLA